MNLTRATRRHVPVFSLYGEQRRQAGQIDSLHIEDIQSRSRKYLWQIAAHRHAGACQCVFVATGPVTYDLEASRGALEGPALIVVPSGTVHAFGFRAETEGYVLTMNLDRLLSTASTPHQAAIAALFAAPRALSLPRDRSLAGRVTQLFAALVQEFRQPDSLAAPVTGWLACSTLWVLAASCVTTTGAGVVSQDWDRLRRFRLLIESHYLQHWPVERYARQLALSSSSLNRLCRHLAGSTAFDLAQQRLALEARRRLLYQAGSVATLAAELGFTDTAYFSRFFRKHAGLSPTAFRRLQDGG